MKTNINVLRLIFIVIIFNSLTSCYRYKLSREDLKWQPYKVGDILIFESNKNNIDTIFITDINLNSNPEDYSAFFSDFHEVLYIIGEISLVKPKIDIFNKQYNRGRVNLLTMFADKKNYIEFDLNKIEDTLKYGRTKYTIEYIKKYFSKTKKLNFKDLKDVIPIHSGRTYSLKQDLTNFYWSKKYGYVYYEFKNGVYWEIKKFIRNGKNILKK